MARLTIAFPKTDGAKTEVIVGSGVLPGAAEGLTRTGQGAAALVVIDANLPRALIEPLLRGLDRAGVRWGVSVLTASETGKSLAALQSVLEQAAGLRLERGDLLVGVGGGVVCDIAGFAAAIYRRGVRHVLCPTTLLAMVDASVGGKAGVNLTVTGEDHKPRLLKNMVGAFHQPARVVCDASSLASLAPRELRAGLAECLKHGLIGGSAGDAKLWDATERAIPRVAALDEPAIAALVTRHVRLKARVVERDERETSIKPDGGRMMLNLGHTFAHVLEVLGGLSWELEPLPSAPRSGSVEAPAATLRSIQHGPLLHGEAVGLGLLAACTAGERLKITPRGLGERVRAALLAAGLPTRVMGLPSASTVAQRMQDDKKVSGGHLRLIVPTAGWKARVVVQPAMEAVTAGIDSLREG